MHVAGVGKLTHCHRVLAKDFAASFPDQKSWFKRLTLHWDKDTLAETLVAVDYTGRPEYFSMFGCVYSPILGLSAQWLSSHRTQLKEAMAAFSKEYGFDCSPAQTVVIARGEAQCCGVAAL